MDRAAAITRNVVPGALIERAAFELDADEEIRSLRFVASDETVDRYGDIVSADGWQLADFKRNPIFLWAHQHTEPLGTVPDIEVKGRKLLAGVKFAPAGASRTVDEAWALVQANVLRAVSVGFTIRSEKDYELIRDKDGNATGGIRYLRQELLELSLVSVPANPNAVALARSHGVSDSFIARALLLDASVRKQQSQQRQRIDALRIAGLKHSAPRQASTR